MHFLHCKSVGLDSMQTNTPTNFRLSGYVVHEPELSTRSWVIYPDFPLELTGFFQRKHVIQFLANKMQDF